MGVTRAFASFIYHFSLLSRCTLVVLQDRISGLPDIVKPELDNPALLVWHSLALELAITDASSTFVGFVMHSSSRMGRNHVLRGFLDRARILVWVDVVRVGFVWRDYRHQCKLWKKLTHTR